MVTRGARWARRGIALASLALAGCAHTSSPSASASTDSAQSTREATAIRDGSVTAADGTKIHFLEGGRGNIAIFFIHGWLGNAHWWDEQLAHFGPRYRVVALDLADFGQSGHGRKAWTLQSAADDARAVAEKLGLDRVVWVGHSMSGDLIVEIANRVPERTAGLIPIDTLQDFTPMTGAEKDGFLAPLQKDFVPGAQAVFKDNLLPSSPEPVVHRLLDEVSASPKETSIAALRSVFDYDVASAIRNVKAPVVAVNSDRSPTRVEENRNFCRQFDVILMKNVGHWPMLERPREFDDLLQQAIDRTTAAR